MAITPQQISRLERMFMGIRDERGTHLNTATRIGTAFLELLALLEQLAGSGWQSDDYVQGESGFAIYQDEQTGKWIIELDEAQIRDSLDASVVNVSSLLTMWDGIFQNILQSEGARSGFTDGHGIILDALTGVIQADGMEIRGFLKVMELVINRLQLMESDYSFTEGATTEHCEYEDYGQTLVLTMHKEHDNDYIPFYPGDILYGKVNDLLGKDATEQMDAQGHTVTRHGSFYTVWLRVVSVDHASNVMRCTPYVGCLADGTPVVPGARNFSLLGTAITDDVSAPMLAEFNERGGVGFDMAVNLTRHGNVADGINPATNQYDASIYQSQLARQQSWVLSTTDKRLSMFWNVDAPIIRDENYALCLGMLPDLANLPVTRNPNMPSLYVNTVFADHFDRANYPAKIVKEDRGPWQATPLAVYRGNSGQYVPDGTLSASDEELQDYLAYVAAINSYAGIYDNGDVVYEPYHFKTFTKCQWLTFRLDTAHYRSLSDKKLLLKMLEEWKESVDLEVSRAWAGGKLWELLVDGSAEYPELGCTDWQVIAGDTVFKGDFLEAYQLYDPENFHGTLSLVCNWGLEDVTSKIEQADIVWTRYTEDSSGNQRTASDTVWNEAHAYGQWPTGRTVLTMQQSDLDAETEFPTLVRFICDVTIVVSGNTYTDRVIYEYS